MLLSMTGFGNARRQNERLSVAVEVRSVNNRYLKISTKCPDAYATLENRIEKTVRNSVSRGTVTVTVRIDRFGEDRRYVLNRPVLEAYWKQMNELAATIHVAAPTDLSSLLDLPGAVSEEEPENADVEADWAILEQAVSETLGNLKAFRETEGRSMEQDLRVNSKIITGQLDQVSETAPQVVRDYRDRMEVRVGELLKEKDVSVEADSLIREVSVFADKCDVNEEITRLRSHLEQFDAFMNDTTSQGRKLEFLSQEMFREVNTIGSKANNVAIAHCVVEMKAAVEKMREILQNVE